MQKDRPEYFANLDSLRFLAFLGVFVAHSLVPLGFPQDSQLGKWMIFLCSVNGLSGVYGVKFFFVLSGFLISYLMFKELKTEGRLDRGRFYMRRILRIWPLYFLIVLIAFFLMPALQGVQVAGNASLVKHLLFLSNFDLAYQRPIPEAAQPLWSLAVEEQFYAVWPLLFALLAGRKPSWFIIAFTILALGSLTFQIMHLSNPLVLSFHSLSNLWSLTVGGAIAWLMVYRKGFRRAIESMPRGFIAIIYILGMASAYLHLKIGSEVFWCLHDDALAIFFGFVVLEQGFSRNSIFKLGRIRLFESLGKISYGLYMWHILGIILIASLLSRPFDSAAISYIVKFAAAMAFAVILSLLSYRLIELPFLRLKARFN